MPSRPRRLVVDVDFDVGVGVDVGVDLDCNGGVDRDDLL